MPTVEAANADVEANGRSGGDLRRFRRRRRRRRRHRPSSSETTTDGSFRFSDSDNSWHSPAESYDECRFCAGGEGISVLSDAQRSSCPVSECLSDEEVDLESGELELKVHKHERDCRICHLSLLHYGGDDQEEASSGPAIELGCSCKGDLGSAHKQCAETWFKIKGNTTCEICGAIALNIAGEQVTEVNNTAGLPAPSAAPIVLPESRSFWHGRRVMNFLLACMVFAFVISWLFHFNVLP